MVISNPAAIVDKYIKSATYGFKYTERTKLILTLIIIPIWILCFAFCILEGVRGAEAIKNYKIAKNLKSDVSVLEMNKSIRYNNDGESTKQLHPINLQLYQKLGINNPDPCEPGMPQMVIDIQKSKIYSLFYIPGLLLIVFFLPWLLLRIIFKIKRTDNVYRT